MFKTRSLHDAFHEIAEHLDVPAATLMAVAEVESGGRLTAPVRGKREPLIRFEGHYFHRLLSGDARDEARKLGLAHPKAGHVKNPRSQSRRWDMLDRAIALDRVAALSSCSWGLGQVMGSHWRWLDYGSVDALVAEARRGVAGQVALMARFIEKADLAPLLRSRDWAAFARRYNGPGYRKNRYHLRMREAYERYRKLDGKVPVLPEPASAESERKGELKFGSRGEAVRDIQERLNALGYVLVVDGVFGLVTDRVVREFQADQELPVDGMVSGATRRILAASPTRSGADEETRATQARLRAGIRQMREHLRGARSSLLSIIRQIA